MNALLVQQKDRRLEVPLRELCFEYSRSSGPGGQNVNKVNSRVALRWNVRKSKSLPDDVRERLVNKYATRITQAGELRFASQRFRDQGRNVADCLEKLRTCLESVLTIPTPRKRTRPSRAAQARRLTDKRARSEAKRHRRSVSTANWREA